MGSFNATCGLSGMPIWCGVPVIGSVLVEEKRREIGCYVFDYAKFAQGFVEGEYNDYGGIEDAEGDTILDDRIETGSHKDGTWNREWVNIWMCRKDIYEEMLEDTIETYARDDKGKAYLKKWSIREYVESKVDAIKAIEPLKPIMEDDPLPDSMFKRMRAVHDATQFTEGGMGIILRLVASKLHAGINVTDKEIDDYRKAYSIYCILGSICRPLALQGNMGSQDASGHKDSFLRMQKKVAENFVVYTDWIES